MVTVQEKPWAAPMAMTSAALMPYWPAPGGLEQRVQLADAAAVAVALPSLAFSAAFSCSRAADAVVPLAGVPYGADGVADRVDRRRDTVLDRSEDGGGGLPRAVDR